MSSGSPHPIAQAVASGLDTVLFDQLIYIDQVASTNDECKHLAREGAAEGLVVIAGSQSAGRGRLGREWSSPTGGLYLSALLRPATRMRSEDVPAFPLCVAVAVARAAEGLGAAGVGVKWPNDVMTPGGKLAGILVESSVVGEGVAWLVIGIGLNLSAPRDPVPAADYLSHLPKPDLVISAATSVLNELANSYDEYCRTGFLGVREEYERRSVLVGRDVTVTDGEGELVEAGKVRGFDEAGRLQLDTDHGSRFVVAGDVTLGGR